MNDIIHLKKEKVLHYQNHKKYQHLFDNNFIGIGILDENNVMIQANDSLCNILGVENKNLEKIKAFDFILGDELKIFIQEILEFEYFHFSVFSL